MAESDLLCAESNSLCFDDLDCGSMDEKNHQSSNKNPSFGGRSDFCIGLTLLSEESLSLMIQKETEYLPKLDYLKRLRSGDLDLRIRREAFDWMYKAHSHYSFGPLSICLSVNYFDRFLSVYEMPKGKAWPMQLLAVACLSLASKIEETKVPQIVDLQVGAPKFVFEAKTIQRMELLILSRLDWRMQAATPCSFIETFLSKIKDNQHPFESSISRANQLILSTIKGIDFLEFRPSEICAAVAILVSVEVQAVDIDKAISCLVHLRKERVLKCFELIKGLSVNSGSASVTSGSVPSVPQSPVGVLDAACMSYKTDGLTVGSCAISSHNNSPNTKRRKLNTPTTEDNLNS